MKRSRLCAESCASNVDSQSEFRKEFGPNVAAIWCAVPFLWDDNLAANRVGGEVSSGERYRVLACCFSGFITKASR